MPRISSHRNRRKSRPRPKMAEKIRRDQTLDIIENFLATVWYEWLKPLLKTELPGKDQRFCVASNFRDFALEYLEELRRGGYECKKR